MDGPRVIARNSISNRQKGKRDNANKLRWSPRNRNFNISRIDYRRPVISFCSMQQRSILNYGEFTRGRAQPSWNINVPICRKRYAVPSAIVWYKRCSIFVKERNRLRSFSVTSDRRVTMSSNGRYKHDFLGRSSTVHCFAKAFSSLARFQKD